jgi:predicted polyphosphate/ATP-dependent NAD kinase
VQGDVENQSAGIRIGPVGIVCNPASGKDIRRLTARASVFDNQEKLAIVRRAVQGAIAAGAREFLYVPDGHDIAASAFEDVLGKVDSDCEIVVKPVAAPQTDSALDTIRGARSLRDAGCAVAITLGGDGTNRAFILGWPDAPLIPLSTGTNNVFPLMIEATVAGTAAGLVATGRLPLREVAAQAKTIVVDIAGETSDRALIDAVLTSDRFVGSRALLDPSRLRTLLLTRADPSGIGMTSIGGLLDPIADDEEAGLLIEFGGGGFRVRAPIAPGHHEAVDIREIRRVEMGEAVEFEGPGALAFDGERERILKPGQRASLRVQRDGPWVIDVDLVHTRAAHAGWFRMQASA